MRFGRRQQATPQATPASVEAFWAWWGSEGRGAAEVALQGPPADLEVFRATLRDQVGAVAPGLRWACEEDAGNPGQHLLVVTAEGVPVLRASARRWRDAAPDGPEHDRWTYADGRSTFSADGDVTVRHAGATHSVSLDDVAIGARRGDAGFDVVLHHPSFTGLDAGLRQALADALVAAALGEDRVARWLGTVTGAEHRPTDSFGVSALRSLIDQLEGGSGTGGPWVVRRGTALRKPVELTTRMPLTGEAYPTYDHHGVLSVRFTAGTDGMPDDTGRAELQRLDEALAEALGDDGLVVAHLLTRGTRVTHLYLDGWTDALGLVRQALATAAPDARLQDAHDPTWDAVRRLQP
ncbi:DUF695 domain-containing protein [Nocardioides alkalitolerans]|uniref:DUF695 domain-containing protein n=1 Tax=Nocardioides alkalitolerans TaxID=281714 RepID=UPI00040A448A|nr:DUF695 domain-containing protein [Nocardioides alkalitolerans]